MSRSLIRSVIAELIERGRHDWVHMAEAWWVARSTGGAQSDAEARNLALDAISHAIREGLMQVGDVTIDDGFRPWAGTAEENIARLDREWKRDRPRPEIGEIGWLNTTVTQEP